MRFHKLPKIYRIADFLLIPIMFILGGFKKDSIQETHPWHVWRKFNLEEIDTSKTTTHKGTDTSVYKKHYLFLFHAPLFGGWKNYSVLESAHRDSFYIGWGMYEGDVLAGKGLNRLLIKDGRVRMLDGPLNYHGFYFGINEKGEQVVLKKVGRGRLGDRKYPGVRLF